MEVKPNKEVKKSSKLGNLRPVLVDGVLRVGGRLQKAVVLSWDEKHLMVLPKRHHVSQNKPGKVRIVFDAAAENNGTSLNNNLLRGPDSTNCLIGVLIRFRQENTAIVADIKSMLHQVRVREEDQDSLQFLWWDESTGDSLEESNGSTKAPSREPVDCPSLP